MESIVTDCFEEFEILIKEIKEELKSFPEGLSDIVDTQIPEIIRIIKEMESNVLKSSNSLRKKDISKWKLYKSGQELLAMYLLTSNPTDKEVKRIFDLET